MPAAPRMLSTIVSTQKARSRVLIANGMKCNPTTSATQATLAQPKDVNWLIRIRPPKSAITSTATAGANHRPNPRFGPE